MSKNCRPSPTPGSTRPRWLPWRCPLTKLRRYRDGEKLFEAGQRDISFYVVKSGKVEIVDDSEDPPKTLTTLGPGEFTGEVSQLCGSPAPVTPSPGASSSLVVPHRFLVSLG